MQLDDGYDDDVGSFITWVFMKPLWRSYSVMQSPPPAASTNRPPGTARVSNILPRQDAVQSHPRLEIICTSFTNKRPLAFRLAIDNTVNAITIFGIKIVGLLTKQ
jgi:hypothetical protein